MADTPYLLLTCDDGSVDLARAELKRMAPALVELAILTPGVMLFQLRRSFSAIAREWVKKPPIFVRHICPVHRWLPLDDAGNAPQLLSGWLGSESNRAFITGAVDPALPFSVQSRVFDNLPIKPFDLNRPISETVAGVTGAAIDVRAPQTIVSVVCALLERTALPGLPAGGGQVAVALTGISTPAENLSDWAGGMRRFAREEGQLSRAEFKLLEAIEVFAVPIPARGVVLDLGAAPGGWTRVMRQLNQYVTAIDPAELDPRLATDPGVRHVRVTAESYLAGEPDRFDIIVNDMRMDARDSVRLMVSFVGCLYRHGCVVMTLKLPETRREPVLEQAFAILREAYSIEGARQLFHNRSEVTVYLRPLPHTGWVKSSVEEPAL
jgi:23S rRNA (cytidine2498-2'-O)-methyltransferase